MNRKRGAHLTDAHRGGEITPKIRNYIDEATKILFNKQENHPKRKSRDDLTPHIFAVLFDPPDQAKMFRQGYIITRGNKKNNQGK